jgi:hypothetical protein
MTDNTGLPLLIVAEERETIEVTEPAEEGEVVEEGRVKEFFVRRVRKTSADIGAVNDQLADVEAKVGEILAQRTDAEVGGMRLKGVEVALGVSAEGHLGLVTAGVEVSLTLVYERGSK